MKTSVNENIGNLNFGFPNDHKSIYWIFIFLHTIAQCYLVFFKTVIALFYEWSVVLCFYILRKTCVTGWPSTFTFKANDMGTEKHKKMLKTASEHTTLPSSCFTICIDINIYVYCTWNCQENVGNNVLTK